MLCGDVYLCTRIIFSFESLSWPIDCESKLYFYHINNNFLTTDLIPFVRIKKSCMQLHHFHHFAHPG